MIRRIHIKGYKSLVDVDVTLKPFSVLFGPNAVGKSNLLDALQLLSRITTSKTLKEAFEPPYRGKPLESFTFPDGGMEALITKDTVSFTIEADVELSNATIDEINRRILEMKAIHSDNRQQMKPYITVKEKYIRYKVTVGMKPSSGTMYVVDEFAAAIDEDGNENKKRKAFLEHINNSPYAERC